MRPQNIVINQSKKELSNINFTENKGQVSDQNYNPRPNILFGGATAGMAFHLRNNGISYQLNRIDSWKEIEDLKTKQKRKVADKTTIYRIDINWLNLNKDLKIVKGKALAGYNNYYLTSCPNGVYNVETYNSITYQNIYPGIDLKWYEKDGQLKYDYYLAAGADYKNICFEISGAERIYLNSKGDLIIKTPLDTISEQSPVVIQNGAFLRSKWVIKNNIVSYAIENIDPRLPIVIDPVVRSWGTYYGGAGDDRGNGCSTDASGNVYMAGETASNTSTIIATAGAHQTTLGGGSWDAFLVKFNSAGVRQWATYYGGSVNDWAWSCSTDINGNIYMTGETSSSNVNVIATGGSHQSAFGGGFFDAFLVKFNSSGVRQWGTYYGANTDDRAYSCATDGAGNVYMSGITGSFTGTMLAMATAGSHQTANGGGTWDAFLVKFNPAGVRQWGTFYGGSGDEWGRSCITDATGNVYLAGESTSNTGTIIASVGSHQPAHAIGLFDAYLVKFNSFGARQWGTYYGGTGGENGYSCATDALGNVYLAGLTSANPGTEIATVGSHQPTFGGGLNDAYLVQFNSGGMRQWGTYYGGSANDLGYFCNTDAVGNIYLSGTSASNLGTEIATLGSHQPINGGGNDAFLTQFNTAGQRQWGTYYGGTSDDWGYGSCADGLGNVYLTGYTESNTGTIIATAGAHQTIHGGGTEDAFLVQFNSCVAPASPINTSPNINLNICANTSASLFASGSGTLNWFATSVSTLVLGTGTIFITPVLGVGVYTFYVEALTCAFSNSRTAISLTVSNTLPTITVAGSPSVLCAGETTTLTASGAITYTWNPAISGPTIVVSPTITTCYSVAGTAANGCSNTTIYTLTIANSLTTLSLSSSANSLCSGQSATLNALGAGSYTWLPGAVNSSSLLITPPSSQTYSLIGVNAFGCKDTIELTIQVTATPTLSVTPFFYLCSGSATLNASGAQSYSWAPGNLTGSIVLVSPPGTTNYTVVGANGNCTNSAMSTVSLGVAPAFIISSNTLTGCKGTCFTFSNNFVFFNPYAYFWGDSSSAQSLMAIHCYSVSGNYQVVAQAIFSTGCSVISNNTLNITIFSSPTASINVNVNSALSINTPITFNNLSAGAQFFEWNFDDKSANIETNSATNVIHSYTTGGTYCPKLIATETIHNCKDSTKLCIDVLCKSEIIIPNIFTPNNDGANDVFTFKNTCIRSLTCIIYNRWGLKLYEWTGINGWWDGRTDAGLPVSDGVYFFLLNYQDENNNVVKKTGWINILN